MNGNLGKLKKTTNKKCPDCGKPLQIRRYGEKEKLSCSYCEYEVPLQPRRIRRKEEVDDD
jgi:DNA-directed RNA polymerase subunit M/transcription elongation factor TFIIS